MPSNRTVLTDGTGAWFDMGKATVYREDTRWDGSNHISCATGSQWDHELLYKTAGGRWILHRWSQWQGSNDTYVAIDNSSAAVWLILNGHDSETLSAEIASLEIA